MTTLDAKLRPLALSIIAKYGKPITFRKNSDATYDAATGTANSTNTTYPVKATIENVKVTFYGSSLVQQGDLSVLIAALGIPEPKPGDQVAIDGRDRAVVDVTTFLSGELPALYRLLVR